MEISLRKFSYVSLFLLFLCGIKSQVVYAQQITVSGVITDAESGDTLPGVNIVVKGSALGTASGTDGSYQLNVPSLKDTLVFSFVGYQTREVPINGRSEINVELLMQTYAGEELVVVGYGQQKQISMTGSISQVSGDDISGVPTSSLGNALTGKVSGLATIQTTGQPGLTDPDIFLRGISTFNNSTPLVVIDGIPSGMDDLMRLEASSIESISILKDASATAVYGVRGANGVIIAQTKRGDRGGIQISADLSAGIQSPTKSLEFVDAYRMSQIHNRAVLSDGNPSDAISEEVVNAWKLNSKPILFPNIDWWDRMSQDASFQSQNNISIQGGSDDARYFVSLGHLHQDGFIDGDIGPADTYNFGYNRYNISANIDVDLTPTTLLKLTSKGRIGTRREPNENGTSGSSFPGGGGFWDTIVRTGVSYASPGVVDGKFITVNEDYYNFNVGSSAIEQIYGQGYLDRTENNFDVSLDLNQELDFWVDGLEFNSKVNYASSYFEVNTKAGDNFPTYTPVYRKDAANNSVPNDLTVVFRKNGSIDPESWGGWYSVDRSLYWETSLNYSKDIGDHQFTGLLLYNQSKDYYPGNNVAFSSIPSGYIGSAARVTYNYDDRYLAEVNMGYNGSENFAKERRFGLFPAVSGGWIISNEEFFEDVSFMSHLKLRASWGKVGSDQTNNARFIYLPDQYERTSSPGGSYNFGVDIPTMLSGSQVSQIGNPNVTWETAIKQNYGIEARFFEDRLSIKFDYFFEDRVDILMNRNTTPIFLAQPLDLPQVNIGEVKNQGYEVEFSWNHQPSDDFSYYFSGNWSFAKNEIIEMDEVPPTEPYQRQTGNPIGTNFGYIADGFYTEERLNDPETPINELQSTLKPGDVYFKDVNGDGVININDRTRIGYPRVPQVNIGAQIGFNYKQFSVNTVWQGVTQVSRVLSQHFRNPQWKGPLQKWLADSFWTPERAASGTSDLVPRASIINEEYNFSNISTMWVRDASYLRMKSAEIGYVLKPSVTEKIGLKRVKFYLDGYNLLTFVNDEYKTADPEKDRSFNNSNLYPMMKVYNLGVNIDF